MNPDRFDTWSRWLATLGDRSANRRRLLHVGAGAATGLAAGRLHASAQATPPPVTTQDTRPPGGPSVEQKAFDLLYDLESTFRFVANEVMYDPYPGALRGA